MPKTYLQPIGAVGARILHRALPALESAFRVQAAVLRPVSVPQRALSTRREQYHSTVVLRSLLPRLPLDALRVLGVTEVDLYVPRLNFVFGEAVIDGKVALISLRRLYPEFYGLPPDDELLLDRAVKEAVHELGHTFGLRHCSDRRCVMRFSNRIEDTDHKSGGFCNRCRERMELQLEAPA